MSDTAFLSMALSRLVHVCQSRGKTDDSTGTRLSEKQLRTLSYLDVEDPTMVTELADFIGVTASTMSLNLTRLEAGGYVTRARDPHDRRARNVRLTEEGHRILEGHAPFDPERLSALLTHVRPEDRKRALDGMAILAEAADAAVATGGTQLAGLIGDDSRTGS